MTHESDLLANLLKEPGAERIIEALASRRADEIERNRLPERKEKLVALYSSYVLGPPDVQPGDLVVWKAGLKNRTVPAYGQAAVVVEVLKEPVQATTESSGSAYFKEPLTHRIGVLDDDDEMIIFYFDGHRFERLAD